MYIRLFESGLGCDYIELEIKPMMPAPDIYKPAFRDPQTASLARVLSTLLECTDIEEISIGRERDNKLNEEAKTKEK